MSTYSMITISSNGTAVVKVSISYLQIVEITLLVSSVSPTEGVNFL
jgi:hypothetical protein